MRRGPSRCSIYCANCSVRTHHSLTVLPLRRWHADTRSAWIAPPCAALPCAKISLLTPATNRAPSQLRRWQVQQIGQLWQYDASPHRWFHGQERQPVLLELIDDHSRLFPAARLYERESLLAHLDLLSGAFLAHGLPLALYVDYHSFFFTSQSEAFTQLGATLRFYDISLRFAPTPQAKGKIERAHDFWQKRLPPLFAAEHITTLAEANVLLDALRQHHNRHEKHRELRSTPHAAWELARKEKRSALRPAPKCPWWPYVFSQRSQTRVGADGRIAVGSQRLRIEQSPGASVTRCLHPTGAISVLLRPPGKTTRPVLLLRCEAPN